MTHELRSAIRHTSTDIDTGEVTEDYPAGERSAHTLRRSIENRATKLVRCMRRVEGQICGGTDGTDGCGRPRGPGVFRAKEPRQGHGANTRKEFVDEHARCHARSCPRCARIRAAHYGKFGDAVSEAIAKRIPAQVDRWGQILYRARLVTLTSVRDPADPAAHTVAALRSRERGLRSAWRAILAHVRSTVTAPELLGAFYAIECAGTGHVHLHVLYHGPWVDLPDWIAIGRSGYTDMRGRVYPGYADLGDISDVRLCNENTIREVAKYPIKTPGSGVGAEDWIAGEAREVMHPALVARWEIATHGRRLVERYGFFRDVHLPEEEEIAASDEELDDPPVEPCPHCGHTGARRVVWPTRDWIVACRIAGIPAFGTVRVKNEAPKGEEHA